MPEDFTQTNVSTQYGIEVTPPIIQWRRGDLTNPNPSLKNGCWQLPVEQWEMFVDKQPVDVLHAGGVVVPSYLFDTLHLAVLTYRKRWYIKQGDEITWLNPGEYVEGAKSKMQAWVYVKEIGEFAIVTMAGMNAKYFSEAINTTLTRQIIAPASRRAKQAFARFHFWLLLSSAGMMQTKNNQHITPPHCPIQRFDIGTLRSLFVGSKVAEVCEAEMPLAESWSKAREEAKPPAQDQNGNDDPDDFDEHFPRDEQGQPVQAGYDDEDDIPF